MLNAQDSSVSLYSYLSARVPPSVCCWLPQSVNVCCWLPQSVNVRGRLPATPRRIAWAVREIARCGYQGQLAAEAIAGRAVQAGADAAASIATVMQYR